MGSVGRILAVAVLLGWAAVASATPIIQSNVTTEDSIIWTYSYTIVNQEPTPGVVFDLYLPAWGDISDVQSPAGWYPFWAAGFVQWSADFGAEVPVGGSLGGFSFSTDMYPAYWSIVEVSVDDGLPNSTYTYIVPAAVPIPEPMSLVYAITALSCGAGFFALRRRDNLI